MTTALGTTELVLALKDEDELIELTKKYTEVDLPDDKMRLFFGKNVVNTDANKNKKRNKHPKKT